VWRADGSLIQLADKPQLWRLLDALVSAPQGISKEQLVVGVWDVEYHPLRHDKLLHNAIHKLRKLIEDDPAVPRRIPTTNAGYRLGDDAPLRIIG
jgi:DNA-binding response OmpR family regulator